jgi:hypothetical protein
VSATTPGKLPKGSVACMRKPVRADKLIATVKQYC